MKARVFNAVGVDVGGTKVAAGIVTFPDGSVHQLRVIPTVPQRPGEVVLSEIEKLIKDLIHESGVRADGIGIGVCEITDLSGAVVSSNCLAWQKIPVRERLSALGPAVVEADVRAAARAEALFGAGKGSRIFLYVTIGTGISSCLVIDGQPFTGARGASGTMASGPFVRFDPSGASPLLPALEQIASGPALVARFNAAGGAAQSGQEVLSAAAAGDPNAVRVVRSAAEALGETIGLLVNVLDPELVILGGGLGLSRGLYRDCLIDAARRQIWWGGHRDLPIISASTGTEAGVIGAAATAWKRFCALSATSA